MQALLQLAQAFVCVIAIGAAATSVAAPLDVGARSELQMSGAALGSEVRVWGTLRDELGRGIAYRRVQLSGERLGANGGASAEAFETEVISDASGGFAFARVVPEGAWELRARFAGDFYIDGASQAVDVQVARLPARLSLEVPAVVGVDLASIPVRAALTIGGTPVPGALLEARADCGVPPVLRPTDGGGESGGALAVREREGGECAVWVRAFGAGRFDEVEAEAAVRRLVSPVVGLEARHTRPAPFASGVWTVRTDVRDPQGPVPGARMELFSGDERLGEGRTDSTGAVEFTLEEERVPDGAALSVVLVGDAGDLRLRSDALTLRVPPSASRVFGWSSAGLVVLLLLAVAWAVAREVRGKQPKRPPAPLAAVSERPSALGSEGGAWWVVVCDADTGDALSTAQVWVDGEERALGEEGRLDLGEARAVELRVRALGYVPSSVSLRRPRTGRETVVRVRSIRGEVREVLRGLVAEFGGEGASSWWGVRTIADVRRLVGGGIVTLRRAPERERLQRRELGRLLAMNPRQRIDAFEALTLLVDAVYFGGHGSDEAVIALARELADEARASSAPRSAFAQPSDEPSTVNPAEPFDAQGGRP